MNIAEALRTSIEFETQVRHAYAQAAARTSVPHIRQMYELLAKEEQGHLDYLGFRLAELQKSGQITVPLLATAVASPERIRGGVATLQSAMTEGGPAGASELATLRQILKAEEEVSAFYKRMAAELPAEGRALFARFVAIEDGHTAIVQAQIDSIAGLGYWFDVQEFIVDGV